VEISPSRKRLLWRLLIAWIVLSALLFVWVGFGRGHGSSGTTELQVPPTNSMTHVGVTEVVRLGRLGPTHGAAISLPTMTVTSTDWRSALWRDPPGWHPSLP
jgi:hypothetical protein